MIAEHFAHAVACRSWAELLLLKSDGLFNVNSDLSLKPLLSHLPLSPIISPTCFLLHKNPANAAGMSESQLWDQAVSDGTVCTYGAFCPHVGGFSMKKISVCLSMAGWSVHGRLPGCRWRWQQVFLSTPVVKSKQKAQRLFVTIEGREGCESVLPA